MKLLNIFIILSITNSFSFVKCNQSNSSYMRLEPEIVLSDKDSFSKTLIAKNAVVVSANNYATEMAWQILKKGGNAADATITLQLILGLVEPQSSGLGGGSFLTYYQKKNKQIFSYEGREKAPLNANENLFIKENGEKFRFFEAVVGGLSVGVPGTLDLLYNFHKDFGKLSWKEVLQPVIKFSENGFYPPERLKKSLEREKFLFEENISDKYFINIKKKPNELIKNREYTNTLKKILANHRFFYEGEIAKNIINKVKNHSKNPGLMELADLLNYKSSKSEAFCAELRKFFLCGPHLPSSGSISIIQTLILYEKFDFLESSDKFDNLLNILEFVYKLREQFLADSNFEEVNIDLLLNPKFLIEKYNDFKITQSKNTSKVNENEFNSTSHFSIVDFSGNVVSMTSSIENSFGSRQYVNGFLLNNQLTDFFFIPHKNGKKIKNRVQGGKKPLSSMSPIIILDKKKNFLLSVGSPGGTAIISYVVKSIIDVLYLNLLPEESIKKGNFVSKNGKIFIEKDVFNKKKIKTNSENVIERNLISGIAIIKKEKNYYKAAADFRRDGSVVGE